MATKTIRLLLALASLCLTACASIAPAAPSPAASPMLTPSAGAPIEIQVFAAASLVDAFGEIGQQFETSHPGLYVTANYAGSQNLRAQLEQGAVADVFASANRKEMDAAVASRLVAAESPQVFLKNEMVVILPAANPGNVRSLEDLARAGLKLVLAAEEVPVGNYTRLALEQLTAAYGDTYKDAVLANVVSNEDNIKQVVAKVQLGEADAGIVYASDAIAARDLRTIAIPADANVIAEYPIAVLQDAPASAAAKQFVEYVLSPAGQSILKKWGFTPVAATR